MRPRKSPRLLLTNDSDRYRIMTMIDKRHNAAENEHASSMMHAHSRDWGTEDFNRVTNEELAQLASIDVLESEAYFELWRRTHALVSDMVHHRIHGQDAQHTVTAFFCHKLPRVLHKFKPRSHRASFEAWLTTVLKNYLNDEWRKGRTRRSRQVELDPGQPELAGRVFSEPSQVDEQAEHEHLVFFLQEIMTQVLSADDRYIFRSRYWEDKTLKEIASELGLSEENVRVRHWRAKKRLHKACKIYRESGLL